MSPLAPRAAVQKLAALPLPARAACAALAAGGVLLCATLPGCATLDLPDAEDFEKLSPLYKPDTSRIEKQWDDAAETDVRIDVKYVGQYTSVTGRGSVVVHGVGLVTGLNGTGGDAAPGAFRTRLLSSMQKRGVLKGKEILAGTDTALVSVQAEIPALVRKGDPIDVRVRIPAGSKATSLAGGWLLPCRLTEEMTLGGTSRTGDTLATATGPVLTREAAGANRVAALKRGRILGGGVSKVDRKLKMNMRHDFKGTRMVTKITDAIGRRFHHRGPNGTEESVADPQTDLGITLDVLPRYREDYPRYLRVVDSVAMSEHPTARRLRIEQLERDLLGGGEPVEDAAIKLEAVGEAARPSLKKGLASDDEEVRFHSAVALAYLGGSDGLDVLRDAAADVPAFRVYALAALVAAGGPNAATELRKLLADPLPETRYGAFRALRTVAPEDPYLNHKTVRAIDPATGEETGPALFHLHPVRVDVADLGDGDGGDGEEIERPEPLVHVNHHRRAEVALFDGNQRFKTPLALKVGSLLVNAPAKAQVVTVSRIEPGRDDARECGTKITDVILACVELGGTYPDVVELLSQANEQHALPGRFAIDAVPVGGRVYVRKTATGTVKAAVGSGGTTPNLYRTPADSDAPPGDAERFEQLPGEGDRDDEEGNEEETGDGPAKTADAAPLPPEDAPVGLLKAPADGPAARLKALFGGDKVNADDWGGDVE